MGKFISRFRNQTNQMNIVMVGFDGAGKTTILNKLTNGNVVMVPIIGISVETASYNNITFNAWEIGGPGKFNQLYSNYFQNTNGIILVVDSNNIGILNEKFNQFQYPTYVKDELHKLLSDLSPNIPLLIFANKNDLTKLSIQEIIDRLELNILNNRQWHVQSCSGVSGYRLNEGLEWLINKIESKF